MYVENEEPPTKVSTTPSNRPPRAAPGRLPMPPNTAATNALMPGKRPMSGSMVG